MGPDGERSVQIGTQEASFRLKFAIVAPSGAAPRWHDSGMKHSEGANGAGIQALTNEVRR
jgi:hypothetical protein